MSLFGTVCFYSTLNRLWSIIIFSSWKPEIGQYFVLPVGVVLAVTMVAVGWWWHRRKMSAFGSIIDANVRQIAAQKQEIARIEAAFFSIFATPKFDYSIFLCIFAAEGK